MLGMKKKHYRRSKWYSDVLAIDVGAHNFLPAHTNSSIFPSFCCREERFVKSDGRNAMDKRVRRLSHRLSRDRNLCWRCHGASETFIDVSTVGQYCSNQQRYGNPLHLPHNARYTMPRNAWMPRQLILLPAFISIDVSSWAHATAW